LLALRVALLGRGATPDHESALKSIADERFGRVLLSAIAAGLAGYALWQLTRALVGGNLESGEEEDTALERAGHLALGVFYGALVVSAVLIVVGADGGGSPREEDRATAYVLDLPAGPLLVGGVGLVFVAAGLMSLYRSASREFREGLKLRELSDTEDSVYTVFGVAGFVARGVVYGLIGVFLVRAAYRYDPEEAVGVDGALSEIAQASYGPFLLGLTAAGLFAFGLYSFVEARYRQV
jgi:hypothetical protein